MFQLGRFSSPYFARIESEESLSGQVFCQCKFSIGKSSSVIFCKKKKKKKKTWASDQTIAEMFFKKSIIKPYIERPSWTFCNGKYNVLNYFCYAEFLAYYTRENM